MTRTRTVIGGLGSEVTIYPRDRVLVRRASVRADTTIVDAETVAQWVLVSFGASRRMASKYGRRFVEQILEDIPTAGGAISADRIGKWLIHQTVKAVVNRKEESTA